MDTDTRLTASNLTFARTAVNAASSASCGLAEALIQHWDPSLPPPRVPSGYPKAGICQTRQVFPRLSHLARYRFISFRQASTQVLSQQSSGRNTTYRIYDLRHERTTPTGKRITGTLSGCRYSRQPRDRRSAGMPVCGNESRSCRSTVPPLPGHRQASRPGSHQVGLHLRILVQPTALLSMRSCQPRHHIAAAQRTLVLRLVQGNQRRLHQP